MSEADSWFGLLAAEHRAKDSQKLQISVAKTGVGAQGEFLKLALQRRRITL